MHTPNQLHHQLKQHKHQQKKQQKQSRRFFKIVFDDPFQSSIQSLDHHDSLDMLTILQQYFHTATFKVGRQQFIKQISDHQQDQKLKLPDLVVLFWDHQLYEIFEDVLYWIQNLSIKYIVLQQHYSNQIKQHFNINRINLLTINHIDLLQFQYFISKTQIIVESMVPFTTLKQLKVKQLDVTTKKIKQ